MTAIAITERDRAMKRLKELMTEHESQLAVRFRMSTLLRCRYLAKDSIELPFLKRTVFRSGALLDAEQKIRELATKLESTKTRLALEQESCQSRIDEINAGWEGIVLYFLTLYSQMIYCRFYHYLDKFFLM